MGAKLQECLITWVEDGKWHAMTFDGVMQEAHAGATVATKYPVATGFSVSDHTIRQNRMIDLDATVSNISFNTITQKIGAELVYDHISLIASQQDTSLPFPDDWEEVVKHGRAKYDNTRLDDYFGGSILDALSSEISLQKVQETYKVIQHLNAEGILVHVATIRDISTNCVIIGYRTSADVSNSYSMNISLSLEQLNVVTQDGSGVISSATLDAEGSFIMATIFIGIKAAFATGILGVQNSDPTDKEEEPLRFPTFQDILDLPHKFIPFSSRQGTRFSYEGVEYTLGRVRWNRASKCFVSSLAWKSPVTGRQEHVKGLALRSGVNLVSAYNTNLPSLVMANVDEAKLDPTDPASIRLLAVVEYENIMSLI